MMFAGHISCVVQTRVGDDRRLAMSLTDAMCEPTTPASLKSTLIISRIFKDTLAPATAGCSAGPTPAHSTLTPSTPVALPSTPPTSTASIAFAAFAPFAWDRLDILFGDHIDDLLRNAKVLDVVSTDDDLWQPPEAVAIARSADDFFQAVGTSAGVRGEARGMKQARTLWIISLAARPHLIFIQVSQPTRVPLNVSPFFSSTSCMGKGKGGVGVKGARTRRGRAGGFRRVGHVSAHHRITRRRPQQRERQHGQEGGRATPLASGAAARSAVPAPRATQSFLFATGDICGLSDY
eukprot:scaffold317823_cov28-Tisochrysis_lutea.AAC.1